MSRTRRFSFVGPAASIAASLVLANCSTFVGALALLKNQPAPVSPAPEVVVIPPMAQEVPIMEPTIDIPAQPAPEPPRLASIVPPSRPPPNAAIPTPKPNRLDAEPVAPADLVGFDFPGVLHVLRKPDSTQKQALSVVWSYEQADCHLDLYFYPDIQTKVFRLLKFDLKDAAGEKLSDTSACMRGLRAARADDSAAP